MENEKLIRDKITDCFEKHFGHFGFKKTAVDEIARELKLSKKTIYHLFDSKETIYYYVVKKNAQQIRREIEQKLISLQTYQLKIAGLVRFSFYQTRKFAEAESEFQYDQEIMDRAFKDALSELLHKYVLSGINTGEFSDGDPELAARFCKAIISESLHLLEDNTEAKMVNETTKAVLKLLL